MPDRRAIAIRHGLDVVKRRHAIATSTDTTPGGKGSANDRRSRRHVADGGERPRPGGQNETGCLAHPSSHNPFRRPTNPQPTDRLVTGHNQTRWVGRLAWVPGCLTGPAGATLRCAARR